MKNLYEILLGSALSSIFLPWIVVSTHAQTIHSPSRNLTLRFALSPAGEPTYQLRYGAKPVVRPSRLAVLLQDQPGFDQGFTPKSIRARTTIPGRRCGAR